MDACLRDAAAFLENEKKTLVYLSSKHSTRGLGEIANVANIERYKTNTKNGLSIHFSWLVIHGDSGRFYQVHVGGLVSLEGDKIDNISYFIAIADEESEEGCPRKVLRKYHFDYSHPANTRRNPHPMFHLQLPGKLPPDMPEDKYEDSHLIPELSEPRVFYFPMSLSLVLHMAFSEFMSDDTEAIREDGGWRGLIKRSQETLWKPYMEKCLNHISNGRMVFDEAYAARPINN